MTGRALLLVLCMTGIIGCAEVTRVESGSGLRLEVEGRTYDQIWQAAIKVVGEHLTIGVGTDKGRGEIQAESTGATFSGDARVGVFITPANTPSPRYVIEVVSRKRVSVSLVRKKWAQMIIDRLKMELVL